MSHLYKKSIEEAIKRCTKTLNDNIRHIHEDVGWHQHLGSHKIGIVASAMAFLYYKKINEECPEAEQVIRSLNTKQNEDGGWPYISNTNGESNVESTCWALLALYEYNREQNAECLNKGKQWLLDQFDDKGNVDSGWPFMETDESRIYTTAFVLRVLKKLEIIEKEKYESAKMWIISSQNDDGGWGVLPDKGSNIFSTCYCILTLLECDEGVDSNIIRSAFEWLKKRMSGINILDSSIECYLELIESGSEDKRIRIPFFHYVLPYVIVVFLKMGKKNVVVYNSINLLLEKCKNGYIEHPMLENSRIHPIWAIYGTVFAFDAFKKSCKKWDKRYVYVLFLNRIYGFRRFNPIRFFISYSKWIMCCAFIFLLTLIITNTNILSCVITWWNNTQSKTLGQLLISVTATFIASFIVKVYSIIQNFVIRD